MINKARLDELVEQKYISVQKHPLLPLYIYNYTQKCQFEKFWNPTTLACRGLILDRDGNIIARPFEKFFNYEEVLDKIPNEPFIATDKLDGSLGIIFKYQHDVIVATRGSFTSDQAYKAMNILRTKYPHFHSLLEEGITVLAEIIYPANRIVCNYGDEEKLVLLTVIDNKTGKEVEYDKLFNYCYDMPVVKRYDGLKDFKAIQELNLENKEGFVIRFESGFRMKIKFADYVRLHRIVTGISSRSIWEYLSTGKSLDELIENVPDEFFKFVKDTAQELELEFAKLLTKVEANYFLILNQLPENCTQKDFALAVFATAPELSGLLFMRHKNVDLTTEIWKKIRPKYTQPFKDRHEGIQ